MNDATHAVNKVGPVPIYNDRVVRNFTLAAVFWWWGCWWAW